MSFGVLTVVVLAGLAGPALAAGGRTFVPVAVGEILAGVIVGRTGLGVVHPAQPTLAFLGEVGFAMLMLTAGMHVPLRDGRLAGSLRGGTRFAVLVALLAPLGGLVAAGVYGDGHVALYAVVLASGSAAVLLPALEEAGAGGPDALAAMVEVTIADVLTIVLVPVVLQPARVGNAALGSLLVFATVLLLLAGGRRLASRAPVRRLRSLSRRRAWALDLRLSLVVLFFLAWLAERSGTSILIAGFGAGLMVAALGGPQRLSAQVRGIAGGFFVPLYFVLLGAQLELRGAVEHPTVLALAAALAGCNVAIHLIAARLSGHSTAAGLAASAQIGVPAAVASLGIAAGVLSRSTATAIVLAALVSLGACAAGVQLLVRRERAGGTRGERGAAAVATAPPPAAP